MDVPNGANLIDAFAAAVGEVRQPLLEWCAGKGHLGRLLGARWGVPVHSLELDAALCAEGQRLAGRLHLRQDFMAGDALAPRALAGSAGRHAVALHACGDLHRRLVAGAGEAGLPALDLVLQHESMVSEDGQPRRVTMSIKAVAIGEVTHAFARLGLGGRGIFAGFLTSSRNGRGLVFHVTSLDIEPASHEPH